MLGICYEARVIYNDVKILHSRRVYCEICDDEITQEQLYCLECKNNYVSLICDIAQLPSAINAIIFEYYYTDYTTIYEDVL